QDQLADQQGADPDLAELKVWIQNGHRPSWEEVRGQSPSLKAYWQQFDSFFERDGVIRRRLEQRNSREDVSEQILVPMAKRKEWLGMIHEGIAGHLGSFKTQAHVRRHLYW